MCFLAVITKNRKHREKIKIGNLYGMVVFIVFPVQAGLDGFYQ